jgi:hypothetical protein
MHMPAPVRAALLGLDIVPPIDLNVAATFLRTLAPDRDLHGWQTYHDLPKGAPKDGRLSCTFYGTLADVHPILTDLNQKGASICILVNEGDGLGRGKDNIVRIRAVSGDFDLGWPEGLPIAPTAANETSPRKYQLHWVLADDEELSHEEWRSIVRRLIVGCGAARAAKEIFAPASTAQPCSAANRTYRRPHRDPQGNQAPASGKVSGPSSA